jgi:ABC-2 type transport system permease protein
LFTIAVMVLLFLCGVAVIGIPLNKLLFQFAGISLLYLLFWFAVSFFIISLSKKSGVNAIALLSIWLLLTIVLPAAVNNYISTKYPVPEALSTMLKQRDGYHRKWDVPKEQTMQQFYTAYPQYKSITWQQQSFDWLWYYAMQHCGDMDAQHDKAAFMQKLQQRNAASNMTALFIPSVNVQLQHNELSGSSLANYMAFLNSTTAFHEHLRQYFYPKIFTAAAVVEEDWAKHQPVYHQHLPYTASAIDVTSLLIFIFLPAIIGLMNLKRIRH